MTETEGKILTVVTLIQIKLEGQAASAEERVRAALVSMLRDAGWRLVEVRVVDVERSAVQSWYARQPEALSAWRQAEGARWRYEPVHDPEWLEITEASWHEALNVLPPLEWKQGSGPESFILSEMWADGPKGPIAWMFARGRGRYYFTLAHMADYEAMREKVPCMAGPLRPSRPEPLILHSLEGGSAGSDETNT